MLYLYDFVLVTFYYKVEVLLKPIFAILSKKI